MSYHKQYAKKLYDEQANTVTTKQASEWLVNMTGMPVFATQRCHTYLLRPLIAAGVLTRGFLRGIYTINQDALVTLVSRYIHTVEQGSHDTDTGFVAFLRRDIEFCLSDPAHRKLMVEYNTKYKAEGKPIPFPELESKETAHESQNL